MLRGFILGSDFVDAEHRLDEYNFRKSGVTPYLGVQLKFKMTKTLSHVCRFRIVKILHVENMVHVWGEP